ncbi:hypothetical protein RRG08_036055 [Elysia crispata]|uniref:Uncharacterized protein n=1 Tax=Elysia crispata TaxID=231223 RepID=A0AAE1AN42_9GAST|nr:hypothetical protein RRG08_036055 [Elysia crispata]
MPIVSASKMVVTQVRYGTNSDALRHVGPVFWSYLIAFKKKKSPLTLSRLRAPFREGNILSSSSSLWPSVYVRGGQGISRLSLPMRFAYRLTRWIVARVCQPDTGLHALHGRSSFAQLRGFPQQKVVPISSAVTGLIRRRVSHWFIKLGLMEMLCLVGVCCPGEKPACLVLMDVLAGVGHH